MRLVWLVGLVVAGCGDDAAPCANDDECPAFHRCMGEVCQPLPGHDGGERDAGATRRDGSAPDTTPPLDAPGSGGAGRLYVIGSHDIAVPEVPWRLFGDFIPAGADCTAEVMGTCTYRECAPDTVLPDAGRITLSSDLGAFEVSPESTGRYRTAGMTPLWADGSVVAVSAKGGEVPGFDLMLVPEPTPLAAVAQIDGAPLSDDLMIGVFRRGEAYFEVEPPTTDRALILVDLAGGEVVRQLRCAFRPGFTDMTIPAAELERFPATTHALVAIVAVASGEAPVDGWSTRVEMMSVATLDGAMAIAQVSVD